ncbi:MAG TPA: acyl-CoA dehydrogenase [Patescibacteria group bacterium]|nr:acyl-CoA dehydrogenase [Patescibacteria group bacterium]
MGIRSAIVKAVKKQMPPISATEKEALASGTVGWDGELMSGSPNWDNLFKYEKAELTAEEQAFLDGPVEKLCKLVDNWEIQKTNDLPPEAWKIIKEEGFMGLEIPKEYGGKGFSSKAHSAVVMKLASRSITAAVTVMVPNSLGPAELIGAYGTQAQKDYYLPRLANGTEIPCFALTGPDAGSDAGSIPDRGVVVKNEKGELGIRLNWEKRYITLGPIASLIGMAFKLEDPDNLLGKNQKDLGITVALVPRDTPGIEIGDRHAPMDLPFHNGPNKGKDVFVPIDAIIGGPEKAGKGWAMLMESLAVGRSLSLPALSTAAAKLSSYATGSYSRVRKQFGTSIANFEGIEEPLARMAGLTYLMNAAREATLQMVDAGERPAIPSAILKYHLTEGMRTIVNDAMDIHGGKAVSNGPQNIFSTLYKGIPIAITVEGANIMTRNLIIFGQGAVRAHPYTLKELDALDDPNPNKAFNKFTKVLAAHLGTGAVNAVKAMIHGATGSRFAKSPKGVDKATRKYYKQINRLSAAFNLAANASLPLGGNLKKKERVSARMGDVYSHLYLASTALWYFEKNGAKKEEKVLLDWAVQTSLAKAEKALDDALTNHPLKPTRLVKHIVFPRKLLTAALAVGTAVAAFTVAPVVAIVGAVATVGAALFIKDHQNKVPGDYLDRKVADTIRVPGEVRDNLTRGVFKPTDEQEPLGKLEMAFKLSTEVDPLEKKLYLATKAGTISKEQPRAAMLEAAVANNVLSADEAAKVKEMDRLRRAVIEVDAFPQVKPAPASNDAPKATPAAPPKAA